MGLSKEEQIFEAAARIFKEKGYHATSVQDIADAVGLQKGSLYHYIPSKEDLLYRIAEQGITVIVQHLEDIANADLSAAEKLQLAMENHVTTLCRQLDRMTVFLKERHALTDEHRAQIAAHSNRYVQLMEQIIEQGINSSDFRQMDGKMVALGLLGMINWMSQWYSPDGRLSPEEIAAVFVDLSLRGILASKDRRYLDDRLRAD